MYALEEAEILEPESSAGPNVSFKNDTTTTTGVGGSGTGSAAGTFNPLEISWLNSRKDTVGEDKEAESWAAAREFLNRAQNTSSEAEAMDINS